jgi:SPP1 family predicted phage head-tail adaptor
MRASKLDREIAIQRATETKDSFNNTIYGPWTLLIKVRASKHEIRDSERISAQEVGADITARFQVRWNSVIATVNPKDRLVFEGRTYGILGVKEIGRREGREITATTRIDTP